MNLPGEDESQGSLFMNLAGAKLYRDLGCGPVTSRLRATVRQGLAVSMPTLAGRIVQPAR